MYDVWVRGLSRERPLPRSVVVTAKWVVSCTRITCIQPFSCCSLTFPASSFFSESVCCCCRCFVFSLFSSTICLSFLSLAYWPVRNRCWLAWLGQPFCISLFVCICLHPNAMSSVVLISDLLYQSAGIVFLDGGRVSEELVMVSLAFHLFVVGTVIFASVLLCQVKSRTSLFLQRKMCHT